ncbi:MAG TPA: 5'/3'-nucleotidase SurE [Planctomycetaceae bacterium]|nr:5'/3'-nucleotidase SurE [Planctomycetaceae bacterium]
MQILLTNDDGIHAPGLAALRDALRRLGAVKVVAPALEQSGVGLSITYLHPLMVREELRDGEHFGWAVGGSPADCVKLGMLEFCRTRPDLVVSGINSGSNVGINVLYSGTVAGAIEGAFFGVTSVAVSLSVETPPDYRRTARMAARLIEGILATQPRAGSLWNINFPATQPDGPRGIRTVIMGVRRHTDVMEKRLDPRGRPYYWSGLNPIENHHMEPGTDVKELTDGYVTITPLRFDLTDADELDRVGGNALADSLDLDVAGD